MAGWDQPPKMCSFFLCKLNVFSIYMICILCFFMLCIFLDCILEVGWGAYVLTFDLSTPPLDTQATLRTFTSVSLFQYFSVQPPDGLNIICRLNHNRLVFISMLIIFWTCHVLLELSIRSLAIRTHIISFITEIKLMRDVSLME